MPSKNVICVVVDRLHAGMVGAYGNSWIRTTSLDRFASDAFVFDQAFVESPQLADVYRGLWQGLRAADVRSDIQPAASLPRLLAAAGLHTALVTDDEQVAELAAAAEFAERRVVETPGKLRTAKNLAATGFARLFDAAGQWLSTAQEPFCLWIHSRGMGGPWDAPLEMRNRFAEEDDPEPPAIVQPPELRLPDDFDPDEPLGIRHAYAGQVTLLDDCWARFAGSWRPARWPNERS